MKVIVGMSGGVDSSVAALLLKKQGYEVHGLFMKNWEEDDTDTYCSASQDIEDAKKIADILDIPIHTINFAAEYWDHVFEYFLEEYREGRTPNPDILCNKEIKFKCFLDYALKLGADKIATGHYARNQYKNNTWQLLKGLDPKKDQSYFLYTLGQEQLQHVLFPIGDYEKPLIRQYANEAQFPNHNKKDSTGICFIGERRFKDFLNQYLPAKPGPIETLDGEIIGEHDGLMFHTIGQRQGLKIGGRKNASDAPWYVAEKDLKRNVLIVVQGQEHPKLFKKELNCQQLHWIAGQPPSLNKIFQAKIRYRQASQNCSIQFLDRFRLHVQFEQPQRAMTPGQSIVFYDGEQCLGGGIIE